MGPVRCVFVYYLNARNSTNGSNLTHVKTFDNVRIKESLANKMYRTQLFVFTLPHLSYASRFVWIVAKRLILFLSLVSCPSIIIQHVIH